MQQATIPVSNSARSRNIQQPRTMSTTPMRWKRFILFVSFLFLIAQADSTSQLQNDIPTEDVYRATADSATMSVNGRMSIANMTCNTFEQPLNHFVPRGRSPAYQERYCTYDGFVVTDKEESNGGENRPPIFFYTGNESPLEQYINQTGLMWELAPKFGARVVFAEHRYEGESLPPKDLSVDCLSYASTMQALADYARLLEEELNPNNVAPVIVFGGSYGGMLSAWMVSPMWCRTFQSSCFIF